MPERRSTSPSVVGSCPAPQPAGPVTSLSAGTGPEVARVGEDYPVSKPPPQATKSKRKRRALSRRVGAGAGRVFACTECGKNFNSRSALHNHLVSHIGRKDWKCDVCHKMFAYKTTLASHRVIHVRDSPYECRQCPKRFAERTSLAAHERSHSGFKPHECHVCGRKYVREGNLDIHLRTHLGEIFV